MSSRKSRDGGEKLPPFVPLLHETRKSPAYRQLSFGGRALFTALSARCFKNNKHVYLSQRDAEEELGHKDRNDIANWFRELVHYGFIVQTKGASLGVDGKGKAPHWRITDMPTRNADGGLDTATREFLRWDGVVFEPHVRPSRRWNPLKKAALKKQNPGRHVATTVDGTVPPVVGGTSPPPEDESGGHVPSISARLGGGHVPPVTRLATGGAGSGLLIGSDEPDDLGDVVDDDGEHGGMITIEIDGVLIEIDANEAGISDELRP
jgi:hypothetical protein